MSTDGYAGADTDIDPVMALAEAMREISQTNSRLISLLAATHGRDRYSSPGRTILAGLAKHGPRTSADMMREMGVARQHVLSTFDRLKLHGLIEQLSAAGYRQSALHGITQAGLDHLAALEEAERPILAELAVRLDPLDLRDTAILLKTMRLAIKEVAKEVYGERVQNKRRWAKSKTAARARPEP